MYADAYENVCRKWTTRHDTIFNMYQTGVSYIERRDCKNEANVRYNIGIL